MALDRQIPTSATPTSVEGDDFMDAVQEELTGLWDRASVLLTDIGGTANAITGTVTPALTGSAVAGMIFRFVATADNTDATTLNGIDVTDIDGNALTGGEIVSGRLHSCLFDGTGLRLLGGGSGTSAAPDYQTFTASGTWNKPAGVPDNARVIMEGWGAGGGGGSSASSGGGGGGGAYMRTEYVASAVPSSLSVTVPGATAVAANGGNASVDNGGTNYLIAYGGGSGGTTAGGGGAGALSKGCEWLGHHRWCRWDGRWRRRRQRRDRRRHA